MTLVSTAQTANQSSPAPGTDARRLPADRRGQSSIDAHPSGTDDVTGATGAPPTILRRRLAPFDARLEPRSWLATAVIVVIAAILRLVDLSRPKGKIFDEVYYATDAHNLLTRGIEWDEKNNTAAYIVHPPLGKWMIALGEWAFGYHEFGWRVSAALTGTLSVLLLIRIARRLFHSTVLGCAAGLLMALDGFHLVLSRSALLDIFLLFFVLAAFGALVIDRDSRRRRRFNALTTGPGPDPTGTTGRPRRSFSGNVPWWRLLAAVLLGCAISVKWSALYFVPVFGLLVLIWESGARRSAGVRRPWRNTLAAETGWLFLSGLLIVGTYLASWSGWLLTDDGYFRHWRAASGNSEAPVIGAVQNLIHYHQEIFRFHTGLSASHTYQSWPWQWLLLGRPVAFYWSGEGSCGAPSCAAEILLLGTPLLWWSFLPALVALLWFGIARRDWRAGAILLGVAAGLLPWFWYALDGRTMFFFYAAPALPFLVLAVVYVLGAIIGPRPGDAGGSELADQAEPVGQGSDRRTVGAVVAGVYVLAVAACFAYFHPVYVGKVITYAEWSARMWLGGRWI